MSNDTPFHIENTFDPPAFPRDHAHDGHNGMSLRDYFAAAALQGWLASFHPDHDHPSATTSRAERQAQMAYKLADAMLMERAK
jgi:hypothetical protein